ncbi:WEB family protein [Cocos nucifera]|uniref:WEB family protein n=1 Tax=Cocos nucifera TaxID=13894 RepID=A0A8K0I7X1_COCNU|nr:WEB family protein [Cocos nucifera]
MQLDDMATTTGDTTLSVISPMRPTTRQYGCHYPSDDAFLSILNSMQPQMAHDQTEKELELSMEELANRKVQLEIKESANMRAALWLDSYPKTIEQLSTELKCSEVERDRSMEEWQEAHSHIAKLESVIKVIAGQCLESGENQKQYIHILDELKALKEELLLMKAKLTAAEELKVAALKQVELMKIDVLLEKEKSKELLVHISELNQAILLSNVSAVEAEKERSAFYSQMEAELGFATEAVVLSHEQVEVMKRRLDMMEDLENELLEKIILTDYLELELRQAKELVASDAMRDLSQFRSEMEMIDRENSENADYVTFMEAEMKRMEEELQSARDNVNNLNCQVEILMSDMQNLKDDLSKSSRRDLELQVEIATLKSELHKSRSKIAAAEAGEARARSAQAGLYLAVEQLALEAKAAKNETERLKVELKNAEAEMVVNHDASKISQGRDSVTCSNGFYSGITISTEDYEALIQKAKKVDSPLKDESQLLGYENKGEVDILKEELEASNATINDLRSSLEEAIRRSELAEKAKAAVEDQLRKWRVEQKQRRSASEVLAEQSTRKDMNNMMCEPAASQSLLGQSGPNGIFHHAKGGTSISTANNLNHIPLGKFLNMKF